MVESTVSALFWLNLIEYRETRGRHSTPNRRQASLRMTTSRKKSRRSFTLRVDSASLGRHASWQTWSWSSRRRSIQTLSIWKKLSRCMMKESEGSQTTQLSLTSTQIYWFNSVKPRRLDSWSRGQSNWTPNKMDRNTLTWQSSSAIKWEKPSKCTQEESQSWKQMRRDTSCHRTKRKSIFARSRSPVHMHQSQKAIWQSHSATTQTQSSSASRTLQKLLRSKQTT